VSLVRWTEQAVGDLRAIRQFIERDSPRYGRLVAERLFDASQRLEDFPLSGRVVPELGALMSARSSSGSIASSTAEGGDGTPPHRVQVVAGLPTTLPGL